ncbi:MAG: aminodeoxychorismate/anthranilate synthase component II [Syntrophorhabdales bacterium]|jgi:anthranilate synthase/aminodeoxychorismate synthase-like glutamine amidotransferase
MIALIDNYDSFTFNIYDYLARYGDVRVFRNTEALDAVTACDPEGIVISPGPSHPAHSLLSLSALDHYKGRIPILGICLGMQAIGLYFGRPVRRARSVMHGKVDPMEHYGGALFAGIGQEFRAVRYHSLVVECDEGDLHICAVSKSDGEVMAIEHRQARIFGLQFHPESYATPDGMRFIRNFMEVCHGRH